MKIDNPKIDIFIRAIFLGALAVVIASCAAPDTRHHIVISAREQKLALLDHGTLMAIYPVPTSKFGLGDWPGSSFTPLGELEIEEKIGDQVVATASVTWFSDSSAVTPKAWKPMPAAAASAKKAKPETTPA